MASSAPHTGSREGRGILLAIVTGEVGERIQRWREAHDPDQAQRYPPHATLCYWVPEGLDAGGLDALDAQVRHAFPEPVEVTLGGPQIFENEGRTMFVEVRNHHALDEASERLMDGAHLDLAPVDGRTAWTWHVTALRRTEGVPGDVLTAAETDLAIHEAWRIEEIAYLVLSGDQYERRRTWMLG